VNDLLRILIWVVVITVLFVVLWRKGYLMRVSKYVVETREELRKCTWPSVDELKGSTLVILVTIVLLGGFIVVVDFVISQLIRLVT
jgi:preprotein translocase subunit SecE